MYNTEQEKCLALAGVCQAAELVQQVARKGKVNEQGFLASINSIVITDPEFVEQVYGQAANLQTGLATLVDQLGNTNASKDAEITRYIASILGLERKLAKNQKRMSELAERISHIQRQQTHLSLDDTQMMNNLASVYSDVVSPMGPKIQVAGNPTLLKQALNQHKVRALLLAGVRSAVLWRQLGGSRRQILFKRRKILAHAEQILSQVKHLH